MNFHMVHFFLIHEDLKYCHITKTFTSCLLWILLEPDIVIAGINIDSMCMEHHVKKLVWHNLSPWQA